MNFNKSDLYMNELMKNNYLFEEKTEPFQADRLNVK